jgi:hypothetical protein
VDNKEELNISEVDELKLFYYEILNGSSFISDNSFFIKHFSERESYLIQKKKIELFYYYAKEGVPHESEVLENSLKNGEWTKEKENKILELKFAISDNERNIQNIIIEQRPLIQAAIDENKKELSELIIERKQVLGKSVEDLVDDDINDYISFISFFKDEKCKISAFESFEEFEKIDFYQILKLNKILSSHYEKISELVIKKIAAMPFFLNKFSYAKEDISSFLGVPLNDLTHNQNHLFSIGIRNLNVLSNTNGNPPDLSLGAKPINLVNWYDIQNSILISKRNQSK